MKWSDDPNANMSDRGVVLEGHLKTLLDICCVGAILVSV